MTDPIVDPFIHNCLWNTDTQCVDSSVIFHDHRIWAYHSMSPDINAPTFNPKAQQWLSGPLCQTQNFRDNRSGSTSIVFALEAVFTFAFETLVAHSLRRMQNYISGRSSMGIQGWRCDRSLDYISPACRRSWSRREDAGWIWVNRFRDWSAVFGLVMSLFPYRSPLNKVKTHANEFWFSPYWNIYFSRARHRHKIQVLLEQLRDAPASL